MAVRKYSRLQSVLEAENVNALLPQSSFVGAGTFNAAAAAERHYRHFFSKEEEEQYGLVVFQLAVPMSASSAPKSQEEWSGAFVLHPQFYLVFIYLTSLRFVDLSGMILQQLQAKSDTGCSVADLRFAFPSLPVDQIMEILANVSHCRANSQKRALLTIFCVLAP